MTPWSFRTSKPLSLKSSDSVQYETSSSASHPFHLIVLIGARYKGYGIPLKVLTMHEIIDNLFLGPFSAIGHAIPKEGTGNRPPLSHHQGFSRFLQGGGSSCRLPAPEQIKHQFYCWRLRWREQVSDLDMSRLPGPDDWEIPPQSGQRGRMPRFWSFHWDKVAPPSNGWLVYE